jgi:tripartite ATP-independent transporter DctP family solute receptor
MEVYEKVKMQGGIIMLKVSKSSLLVVFLICVLVQTPFIMAAGNQPIEFKVALQDPPTMKIGDATVFQHCYATMLAFKSALERYSGDRFKVELYTHGRLGDGKSTIEQVLSGNIGAAVPGDATLSPFYKNLQVLMAPYVFEDMLQLYKVVDGPFGKKLFNDMAAKSGLRVLACYENGGFRSFSNNKRVVRVPSDMKGLKIRVPEGQILMEIVKATGASATPVSWLEVYSALQTGVADGQENSALVTLSASLQEVQKYYILNKHVLGTTYLIVSERFLKSLSPALQLAFKKAGMEAAIAGRGAVRAYESLALEKLKKSGVKVYIPTAAEMKLWQKTGKSAIMWLRKNTDSKLVDELLSAAKKALITK